MAGTINTTNYNFKKYAPDDTVSMLQTFNGNMDAIDKAIKDRADVETEQGASITKLENGLASTNNGLNSANQTISAVQVQVTTNTRDIKTANTELDTLDSRVQALEDGGSAIENVTLYDSAMTRSYTEFHKQGNHYFGTIVANRQTSTSQGDTITVSQGDNISYSAPRLYLKVASMTGNPFGLNPNIAHAVGFSIDVHNTSSTSNIITNYPAILLYDGSTTYIAVRHESTWTNHAATVSIDTVV